MKTSAFIIGALLCVVVSGCSTSPLVWPQNRAGVTLIREGKYYDAIPEFDHALEKETNYAFGLNNRGMAFTRESDFNKALDDLERATKVRKKFAHAENNRGVLFQIADDDEAAEANYRRAISNRSKYEKPYFNLARLYYARQDFDLALTYVEKAIQLEKDYNGNSDWEAAEYLRSLILEQLGEKPTTDSSEEGAPKPITNASTKPAFSWLKPGVLGS